MSFYEFTGKSVKDAVAKACQELNVEEAQLDVEVLEESARGFLGIVGQRDARVRVKRRDILAEALKVEAPPQARRTEQRKTAGTGSVPHLTDQVSAETDAGPETPAPPVPGLELLDQAKTILQDILQRMLVDAQVHASVTGTALYLDIEGDGSGLLIGKKGQTLDALQYLMNKIINKDNPPGEKIEVIVDTENYRQRRQENLREMALKMSEKAKNTLKPVSLNPMPPNERRIVHLILAEEREVYTKSYGEGPLRRIIVYPRRAMPNKRRRR